MKENQGKRIVVVTGDVTFDWNIARVQRRDVPAHVWNADDLTRACCQRGGAAMLADLVKAIASDLRQPKQAKFEIRQNDAPRGAVDPGDHQYHHSYATWAPFDLDERDPSQERKVWRVQEFLGLDRASSDSASSDEWKKVVNDPMDADLIILDDADLGFRDHQDYWPQALSSDTSKPWILLKVARPVAKGRLWHHLQEYHADQLVAVTTVNDLRRHTGVHISRQISWERAAQDLVWELLYNHHVNAITRCLHVVISFDTAGAMLLSRKPDNTLDAILFFDPKVMEGEWGRHHKGYMIGYTTCLIGGIARELMLNTSGPNISRGIQCGLDAMRFLHIEGYGDAGGDPRQCCVSFPVSKIAGRLADDSSCFVAAAIKNEAHRFWTILEDQNPESLEEVAQKIVREGLEHALSGVPIGGFGKLATVDRREIEALHNMSNLVGEYCDRPQKQPLSIAVFGPPGAGKSFAVEEIAKWVRPEEIGTEKLTFNLSQLSGPDDLLDAFHQVRDEALSGKIPLVFWDEFDTPLRDQPLGWLKYFLAPMQDGEFREGQVTHRLGRSIFVFAGGISHSMEAFGTNLDEEKRRAAKLPDFISRLKGFLNILGPNRQHSENAHLRAEDPYHIIRRAILLRSVFQKNAPQLFCDDGDRRILNIDEGLLRAFLLIKQYTHGVRSMATIVVTSQLAGKTSFERSSLPTEAQLNLHVDGREFYALMYRMELDEDLLEKLAEATHEVFCEDLRAKGYKYGPITQKSKKVHSSLRPYHGLPENEREQNRNNVRDITNKLASVGYALLPARSDEAPTEFSDDEIEKLAEMEHERWMQQKLDAGWRYAKRINKARELHKDLVPWHDLPPDEQEKDRGLVRGIPRILEKAGYTMVRLSQGGTGFTRKHTNKA